VTWAYASWRKGDDPRRGETGVVWGSAPGGSSRTHSAVTGGATAESVSHNSGTRHLTRRGMSYDKHA